MTAELVGLAHQTHTRRRAINTVFFPPPLLLFFLLSPRPQREKNKPSSIFFFSPKAHEAVCTARFCSARTSFFSYHPIDTHTHSLFFCAYAYKNLVPARFLWLMAPSSTWAVGLVEFFFFFFFLILLIRSYPSYGGRQISLRLINIGPVGWFGWRRRVCLIVFFSILNSIR